MPSALFWKMRFAADRQTSLNHLRTRAGLPSANRKLVEARRDDAVAGFVHIAQISRGDCHVDVRGLAGTNVHTVETTECPVRRASHLRKGQVNLDHFIAVGSARVLHLSIDAERIASLQGVRR